MKAVATILSGGALIALAALAPPASAQWTRVLDVPSTDVFSVTSNGDTLAVAQVSTVSVSIDTGVTWKTSAVVAPNLNRVRTVLVDRGRLYAGTDNQGVFVSDDLGTTWANYSQGISGLGAFVITKLIVSGDSLYAATDGGGAWVRNVHAGTWSHFGNEIDLDQGGNMTTIAASGSRLFGAGGFNGTVFVRDPGQTDWTQSLLFNDRLAPGLAGLAAIWTGRRWVVGSNIGIFHSVTGQEPWTYVDFGIHPTLFVGLATSGNDLFASFGAGGGTLISMSRDDGVTWQNVDTLFSVFVYDIARQGPTLYAGRVDGLWRRSIANVVATPPEITPSRLTFAIAGAQPVGNHVRFAFDLPEASLISIEVFDIAGRRVGEAIHETRPAGHGEAAWDATLLRTGVYHARLVAGTRHATVRLLRTPGRF